MTEFTLPADFDPANPPLYIKHDGYLVTFVPDSDTEGLKQFHFVAKRTYQIQLNQRLERSPWQRQIAMSDQYFENAGPYETPVQWETELGPPKAYTDVIVNGTCYAPGGQATFCYPEVKVGEHSHRIIVVGNRVAIIRAGRDPEFTPAEPFSALPVRYEFAYGGVDRQHSMSPLMCPTNPIGTGYLVAPVKGEAPRDRWTVLPNIEDPTQLIQPNTLIVPAVQDASIRSPAGFGWVARSWEPRARLAGMPETAKPLWDKLFGAVDKTGEHFRQMQPSYWNGATSALQVPLLEGHEKLSFKHLHRQQEEFSIVLPMDMPKLRVIINDTPMTKVKLDLNTVQVEIEADEVCLSWRGSMAKPEGMESLDDLRRIVLEVDGELILPAPLVGTGFPIELLTGEFPGEDILEIKGLPGR